MKRILLLAALLVMTGGTLQAQNWQELLKQTATSLGDRATEGKLTQYALPGSWSYTAPGVRFEGESAASDPGAALIASMVKEQLAKVYEKLGIQAGSSTVTFDNKGNFTVAVGGAESLGKLRVRRRDAHDLGTPLGRETREDRGRRRTRLPLRFGAAAALPHHPASGAGPKCQQPGFVAGGGIDAALELQGPLHRLRLRKKGVKFFEKFFNDGFMADPSFFMTIARTARPGTA